MRRARFTLAVLVGWIAWSATAAAATGTEVVDSFLRNLAGVAEGASEFQGRYDRLAPVVRDAFDLPFMARISVGRFWDQFAPDQQGQVVEAFSRLTIATYAARFNGRSPVRFEVLGEEPGRRGGAVVQTAVVRRNGEKVAINYVLQEAGGAWRVVDIYLKGTISESATRRAEYTSVLSRDGLPGLLKAIEQKVAALGAGTAADD